ncbi:hypothetical protein MWM44_15185, partial [Legionella pneumophila]|nr:hypothetical protein [Legionella pneumophila]
MNDVFGHSKGDEIIAKYAGKAPDFKSLEEAKQHFKASYADFGITNEKQWDIFTKNSVEQR